MDGIHNNGVSDIVIKEEFDDNDGNEIVMHHIIADEFTDSFPFHKFEDQDSNGQEIENYLQFQSLSPPYKLSKNANNFLINEGCNISGQLKLGDTDEQFAVELSAYDDNAVEVFPSNVDPSIQVGYHVIDGSIPDSNSNVLVCNTIQDVEGIKKKKIHMKRMKYKYECNICHRRYSTSRILKTHKVRHLARSEYPFKCGLKECHYTAASKIEAKRHTMRHYRFNKEENDGIARKNKDSIVNNNVTSKTNNFSSSNQHLTTVTCKEKSTVNSKGYLKNVQPSRTHNNNIRSSEKDSVDLEDTSKGNIKVFKDGNNRTNRVTRDTNRKRQGLNAINGDTTIEELGGNENSSSTLIKVADESLSEKEEEFEFTEICTNDTDSNDVPDEDTKLQCGLCGFRCTTFGLLRMHLTARHPNEPKVVAAVACPVCPTTFTTATNLRAHLLSHADERQFACDECDRKFIMKNRLVAHKRVVHSPKTFSCSHCTKNFPTIHHLVRHERIHTGEKPYHCRFCNFSCNTQGNLVKHVRSQHDRPDYTYKIHQMELGTTKKPLPESELQELQQKGEVFASRVLAAIDRPDLDINKLKDKVNRDRQQKAYQNSLKKQKNKRHTSNKTNLPRNANSSSKATHSNASFNVKSSINSRVSQNSSTHALLTKKNLNLISDQNKKLELKPLEILALNSNPATTTATSTTSSSLVSSNFSSGNLIKNTLNTSINLSDLLLKDYIIQGYNEDGSSENSFELKGSSSCPDSYCVSPSLFFNVNDNHLPSHSSSKEIITSSAIKTEASNLQQSSDIKVNHSIAAFQEVDEEDDDDADNPPLHSYIMPDMCIMKDNYDAIDAAKACPENIKINAPLLTISATANSAITSTISSADSCSVLLGSSSVGGTAEDVLCDVTISNMSTEDHLGLLASEDGDEEDSEEMATFIINTKDEDGDLIGKVMKNINSCVSDNITRENQSKFLINNLGKVLRYTPPVFDESARILVCASDEESKFLTVQMDDNTISTYSDRLLETSDNSSERHSEYISQISSTNESNVICGVLPINEADENSCDSQSQCPMLEITYNTNESLTAQGAQTCLLQIDEALAMPSAPAQSSSLVDPGNSRNNPQIHVVGKDQPSEFNMKEFTKGKMPTEAGEMIVFLIPK